jgi:arginine/lysine/ornithine decarboxylase
MNQSKTPIYQALSKYVQKKVTKLHVPGHKYGKGLPPEISSLLGKSAKFDLSALEDIDSLAHPESSIKEAQELAAEAFGAKETLFVLNGSTLGVITMILSICSFGDKILVGRNAHKSVLTGLLLSGADPVYLLPEIDKEFNLPLSIKPETVEKAILENPDAKAVLIVNPTQFGITADLKRIADIVHKSGKILLVDEAWGAHFKFNKQFPISAMEAGADMAVQSTHKRLPALSQTSMIHIQGNRIDREKVKSTLRMLQTTSPSYIFLASMDTARKQMALKGEKLWDEVIRLSEKARKFLRESEFKYLDREYVRQKGFDLDPTMITLEVEDGFKSWEILNKNKIEPEFGNFDNLVFIFGIGNDKKDLSSFVKVVKKLSPKKQPWKFDYPMAKPEISLSPREASLRISEDIKIEKAVGRIAFEAVTPYPPGIPLLMPGEIITKDIVDYLIEISRYSSIRMQVLGLSGTIKVVK